jgi:hypothetical protein
VRLSILTALSACVLAGCIGSPEAPKEEDEAAKKFNAHPESAVVYVYRNTLAAAAQTFRLYMDRVFLGDIKNRSFFRVAITPGRRVMVVTDVRNNVLDSLSFDADTNMLHYIEVQLGVNLMSGVPKLVLIGEQEARTGILQCSLLKAGASATISFP